MRQLVLVTIGVLALSTASFAQTPVVVAKGAGSKLLPGTRSGVLSTIEGKAVNAVNNPLAETPVRLRDARFGRIVDSAVTDKQGAFIFRGVDPGTYVVEVMDAGNNTVVAASPLLNISSGEALSTLVKVPFKVPTVAGLLGTSPSTGAALTTAAQAVIAAASASNTVAQSLAGAPATSTSAANGR